MTINLSAWGRERDRSVESTSIVELSFGHNECSMREVNVPSIVCRHDLPSFTLIWQKYVFSAGGIGPGHCLQHVGILSIFIIILIHSVLFQESVHSVVFCLILH